MHSAFRASCLQVRAACTSLQQYGITKIVTSPFRRCVETAKLACSALHLPSSSIEIDWQLSEVANHPLNSCNSCSCIAVLGGLYKLTSQVLTEKLLNVHAQRIPHESISKWMWQALKGSGPSYEERKEPLLHTQCVMNLRKSPQSSWAQAWALQLSWPCCLANIHLMDLHSALCRSAWQQRCRCA